MASPQLIDACRVWCAMKGVAVRALGDSDEMKSLVTMAVRDYNGDFATLNERQRSIIAGLKP